jgi:hypothetical protein
MKPRRDDVLKQLSEIEEGLELEDPLRVGKALRELIDCVGRSFAAPERVVVGMEHLEAAAQVVTGYLEEDENHELLAFVMRDLDERMSVDAEYRLGVMGALAQVACDGLYASVLNIADWDGEEEIDERNARAAARALFAKLMLVRQQDEKTES